LNHKASARLGFNSDSLQEPRSFIASQYHVSSLLATTSTVTLLRSTQSTIRITQCIYIPIIRLKPSDNYVYHQFNTHKSYVLPTQRICVFCVDLRTNSDYFPIQH